MENEWRAEQTFKQLEDIGARVFFEKQLTSSDVSASGRVVVPKAIAEQYLPRIDSPGGMELVVEDAAGDKYTLRFRFWINNQSRMYLLEGTADLQHHLHLKMGDVLIFAQKEDSTIVLAGRPPTKADAVKKPTMRKASPSPLGRPAGGRKEAARVLEAVLAAGLGWDFRMTALLGSDSDDEFQPVVVELSEQQLAELG